MITFFSFTLSTAVCGYHIYQDNWESDIGGYIKVVHHGVKLHTYTVISTGQGTSVYYSSTSDDESRYKKLYSYVYCTHKLQMRSFSIALIIQYTLSCEPEIVQV